MVAPDDYALPFLSMETVTALATPSRRDLMALADLPIERRHHRDALKSLGCFDKIEVGGLGSGTLGSDRPTVTIAAWNAERCKFLDESTLRLSRTEADVILLTEMDFGMARSGNRHTTRDLARSLEMDYAFAVEFVELGIGDKRERTWHAGQRNEHALHGGAILSRFKMDRPGVIRLDQDGDWFDGTNGERRIGGRIAVVVTLTIGDLSVAVVSVHFESHSDPDDRGRSMQRLIEGIEAYSSGAPCIIGGDFNTSTIARDQKDNRPLISALLGEDPHRLMNPVPYEPMFEAAARAGFDWGACNDLKIPTQRTRPDGSPEPPFGKIDWFFTRGIEVCEPATVPAVAPDGETAISDHEILTIKVSAP